MDLEVVPDTALVLFSAELPGQSGGASGVGGLKVEEALDAAGRARYCAAVAKALDVHAAQVRVMDTKLASKTPSRGEAVEVVAVETRVVGLVSASEAERVAELARDAQSERGLAKKLERAFGLIGGPQGQQVAGSASSRQRPKERRSPAVVRITDVQAVSSAREQAARDKKDLSDDFSASSLFKRFTEKV